MGLTVAFDRKKGLEAGLVVRTVKNGTDEDVREAKAIGYDDDYIAWLQESTAVVDIPGTTHCSQDIGFEENFAFAANKWGHTYGPLTTFLKAHGIDWSEF